MTKAVKSAFTISIFFLVGTMVVFSQWNTNGARIYYNNGNVGIGTTSPSSELEVKSTTANDAKVHINTESDGEQSIIRFQDAGQSTWGFLSNYPGVGKFSLYNYQNSTNSIVIGSNDNVGIGTTNPVSKLHVKDGEIRVSDGSDRMYMKVDDANSKSVIGFGDDFGDRLDIFFDYWNGTSSDLNLMSLLSNGNVGIGTSSPDEKLAVKGSIHAQEVKIDLSVPGPDYVFKEGYDLKSLREVQNYIKENGHLPNIPSANEMGKNGIQLGEMNMKLLEKIEELTLYILEQEERLKEMTKLKMIVTRQEIRLKKLEQFLENE